MPNLSPNANGAASAGQVLVHQGNNVWLPYNQAVNTGGELGICDRSALPGNPIGIYTAGDVPTAILSLGSGSSSAVIVSNSGLCVRGTSSAQIGNCDASGKVTVIPSYFNVPSNNNSIATPATSVTPTQSSAWLPQLAGNSSLQAYIDRLAVSAGGRFLNAREFCPTNLLSSFGQCAGNAASPILLTSCFSTLNNAQTAFPLSTAAGDLTSGTFATNSLDWAVINEAIRFSEANGMLTVWLDHPGSQVSYGIVGTFTIKGGVKIRGQGTFGDNYILGTPLMFFTNNADGFQWIGTADPSGVGNFGSGTGGGLDCIQIIKANRAGFGGSSYTGGQAIFLQAQSAAKRPGVMSFTDVFVLTEVYAGGSAWQRSFVADGSAVTTQGTPGVRDVTVTGCRFTSSSDTHKNIWLKYCEHFTFNGVIVDTGLASGGHPGVTVEGDSADIHFAPLLAYAESFDIADSNIVNVSNVSQANPAIVTTSSPHGYTTASGTAQVQIYGLTGGSAITNVNGFIGWATIIDTTHFSIPVDTTASTPYVSGGTVRSASPQDITVIGRMVAVNCTALSASGFIQPSVGMTSPSNTWSIAGQPTVIPGKASLASASPQLKFDGPGKPGFQLEQYGSSLTNVTGNSTVYTVVWNNLNWDYNHEFGGSASSTFTVTVAGTYKLRARVLLNNVGTSGATKFRLSFVYGYTKTDGSAGTRSDTISTGAAADSSGFQTLQLEETVQLMQGDTVIVNLEADGGSKTVGVFGDSGSGFSKFSGELL